jgi:hypothetical protein
VQAVRPSQRLCLTASTCLADNAGDRRLRETTPLWRSGLEELVTDSQASMFMRDLVRRLLAWGVLLTLLLPMVIAVVLGLGALLSSLGDETGAAACGRVGLVIGVAWFLALAATATASGIMTLEASASRPDRLDRPDSPAADQS